MLDKRISFEERYDSEDYNTTTLYFIAPKEFLNGQYPEAEHATISVEFPIGKPEEYVIVEYSPTKDGEDYDWNEVDLPHDEVAELIKLAEKSLKNR